LYRRVKKSAESGFTVRRVSIITIRHGLSGVPLKKIDMASPARKVKATVGYFVELIVTVIGTSVDD
jgi:hypothetical protein